MDLQMTASAILRKRESVAIGCGLAVAGLGGSGSWFRCSRSCKGLFAAWPVLPLVLASKAKSGDRKSGGFLVHFGPLRRKRGTQELGASELGLAFAAPIRVP